jgi:hypothetical protein
MLDPIEIPVAVDTPLYTERVTLDGIEYILKFDWHEREGRWFLGLFTIDEQPLATGIKVVANWPLLRRFTDARMPPGLLIAVDLSPMNGEPPSYTELGTRVKLHYFPADV